MTQLLCDYTLCSYTTTLVTKFRSKLCSFFLQSSATSAFRWTLCHFNSASYISASMSHPFSYNSAFCASASCWTSCPLALFQALLHSPSSISLSAPSVLHLLLKIVFGCHTHMVFFFGLKFWSLMKACTQSTELCYFSSACCEGHHSLQQQPEPSMNCLWNSAMGVKGDITMQEWGLRFQYD